MKELTPKEEEIMQFFWKEGALFVKDLVEKYPDPKPHFNTLSTYVRALEEKGFLSHESFGTTYRYFTVISNEEYNNRTQFGVVSRLRRVKRKALAFQIKLFQRSHQWQFIHW